MKHNYKKLLQNEHEPTQEVSKDKTNNFYEKVMDHLIRYFLGKSKKNLKRSKNISKKTNKSKKSWLLNSILSLFPITKPKNKSRYKIPIKNPIERKR